jgi:TonB-linked SusC/RagA family outer membrane protein
MQKLLNLLLIISCSATLFAQGLTVSGNVYDADTNSPLPGASVVVKGSNTGTTTDFDGNFTLQNLNADDLLVISFIGYEAFEVIANSATPVSVALQSSSSNLDEIVVIGYGTTTKKEVTGAVSVIGAESIEKLNPTRVEQALQGQVSGVNITSGSGSPGSGLNIRIRGISTNGDNNPLILVDGNVIVDLSVLNPNDIESINVIKDATAGIYGVRGANGVILITTKSGRKNTALSLELDTYFGIQTTSRFMDLMPASQYALYTNELAGYTAVGSILYDTDWQKKVFEFAPIASANISASGGTENSSYAGSVSYLYQDGIVGLDKSNYNRLTARGNYQLDITDDLSFNSSLIYTHSLKNNLPEGGIGSVLYSAINMDPTIPVYNANDFDAVSNPSSFTYVNSVSAFEIINPLAQIYNTHNTTLVDKFSANVGFDYKLFDNIKLSTKLQLNHANVLYDVFQPIVNFGRNKSANRTKNRVTDHGDTYDDYTWDNFISYENIFADKHILKVLLGTSMFRTKGYFYGFQGDELVNGLNDVGSATIANLVEENVLPRFNADDISKGYNEFDSRLVSAFARLQYNYDNKYLLSGVIRRDGSSNFSPENKYGIFPSGSFGWNISEEDFFSSSFINSLKFRASYGVIGSDKIQSFVYLSVLDGEAVYSDNSEVTEEDLLRGVAEGQLSNPSVVWEKQKTANVGLDFSLFDSKVNISLDAYERETEDLLVTPQASGLLGIAAPGSAPPTVNAGTVSNKGVEVSIAYNDNLTEDLTFNVGFNVSTIENEVLFVASENGFEQGGDWGVGLGVIPSRMEAGYPIGYFYGYQTNGIYQNQSEIDALDALAFDADGKEIEYHKGAKVGDLKFVDMDGNGFISDEDKTYLGDPIPDFTMGFNLGFNYKDFDFSTSAYASIGNDMVRDYERQAAGVNKGTYVYDRWRGEGTSVTVPRASDGSSINYMNFSDFFVEDASYLRIQNVQVGYTASKGLTSRLGMESLRMYVSVNNLFTFTNYYGFDPSASGGSPIGAGIDKGYYPVSRSFQFGFNITL